MEYPKIQTVFKRDPATKHKTLLAGEYSLPEFEYLKSDAWIFTEKVDGTNIRVTYREGQVEFGGRTDNASIPALLLQELMRQFPVNKFIDAEMPPCILFGEGYGAKVQKGGGNYIADGQSFALFDVWIDGIWLERKNVEDVAAKLGIEAVPMIGFGSLEDMVKAARDGLVSQWGDFAAEGIVARPEIELMNRRGQRIITKIKHKDFSQTGS